MWKVSTGAGEAWIGNEHEEQRDPAPSTADLLRKTLTPPSEKPSLRQPPNHLLRVQLAICAAILLLMFIARQLEWPVFDLFQSELSNALQQGIDLSEQTELVRFVNGVVKNLRLDTPEQKAQGTSEALDTASQKTDIPPLPLTALRLGSNAASSTEPPAGYSLKSYIPLQDLQQPLEEFYVTSGYGWRSHPINGNTDFHTGVDMAALEGTFIGAALPGIVLDSGRGRSYGNYVLLLHSDGVATRYCHMQYVFVRRGEEVEQGGVLGTVGSTGMATGPHLHFELSFDDLHYDPTRALGL